MPLLSPNEFRVRLKAYLRPTSTLDPTILPLPHALLATVIAWGAKFSEHPLLVHDRETNAGRSRICRILSRRAREVSEGEKIHRLPTYDNVIIALLLEPLQSRECHIEWKNGPLIYPCVDNPSDPDGKGFSLLLIRGSLSFNVPGFRGFWLNCGVRHLFELQVDSCLVCQPWTHPSRSTVGHVYRSWMRTLGQK